MSKGIQTLAAPTSKQNKPQASLKDAKYNALKSIMRVLDDPNLDYSEKLDQVASYLAILARNANSSFGNLFKRIPDSFQNAVVQCYKADPQHNGRIPTEQECVALTRRLLNSFMAAQNNKDLDYIRNLVREDNPAVSSGKSNLFAKVLQQGKGLLVGNKYSGLIYRRQPAKNANSVYSALSHQCHEIKKALTKLDILERVDNNVNGVELAIAKNNLHITLTNVEAEKSGPNLEHKAAKRDWVATMHNSKQTVKAYVDGIVAQYKANKAASQALKDFCGVKNFAQAAKQVDKKAYIITQQRDLIKSSLENKFKLNGQTTMTTRQTPFKNTIPSIIRGLRSLFKDLALNSPLHKRQAHLIAKLSSTKLTPQVKAKLTKQLDQVNAKIKNINHLRQATNWGLDEKMMINASQHTISFTAGQQVKHEMHLIRCGHIDNEEAAKTYVALMVQENDGSKLFEGDKKLIIDNRLVYDTNLPKGEAKLLRKHQIFINKAIAKYNSEHPDKQIAIAHLNLPSKKYLGMNAQNTRNNQASFKRILTSLSGTVEHAQRMRDDTVYKKCYEYLELHQANPDYFTGEKGHRLALALKVLCAKNGALPSGGCKSAKDRDGSQKVFDDIYITLLYLRSQDGEALPEDFDEFFTEIPAHYIPLLQEVATHNGIVDITSLNTSYAGSKNISVLLELFRRLGILDLAPFKGQSSKAKG